MIAVQVSAPYATFRKSFARSFAETYPLAPPATVYGMLLSLVGERYRQKHEGVSLAFAYRSIPRIATTLRKLSRFKYGVASKQKTLGNAPDYIETLCDLEFICWIDSTSEYEQTSLLERRIIAALEEPSSIDRYGVLCLGLSDDAVNDLSQIDSVSGSWYRLIPDNGGNMELPIWVDHVGAANTRWRRFYIDETPVILTEEPPKGWPMVAITRTAG